MIDQSEIYINYAKSYKDKSRIFFIEKYLSTFNASKGKICPFILFPRQKVFLRTLELHRNVLATKHRQAGASTLTAAWITAQCVFADKDAPETVLCIGNKLDLANQIVTKIKEFLLQVPRYMWGDEFYSPDPRSEKNKKSIFVKDSKSELELFNGCHVYARSSGTNAARGISAVSLLIIDEAAFVEDGMSVYSSAVAATASVPHSKVVMISTPNARDQLYYETYRQALNGENNFHIVDFKWYQDLRYNKFLEWYRKDDKTGEEIVMKEEVIDNEGSINYNEEKWVKLVQEGWKPRSPWYTTMVQQFNNDSVKIAQELDGSFAGSANNVVSSEYIDMQRTYNVREPLTELKDPMNDETWFWKPPIEGHRYICACDPSRGVGSDNTAIEIIDMDGRDDNGLPIIEQVAQFMGKRLGDDVGGMIYQYATMYNNAFVVADATGGQADALLLTLIQLGYKNLYYEDSAQKTYTIQNPSKMLGGQYMDKLPGFHFQGNRYPVLASFAGMVRNNEFKIRSIRTINELETWIYKGDTGRIDHQEGSHDDSLTCLAMGLFVMKFSLEKMTQTVTKDSAILKAYMMGSSSNSNNGYKRDSYDMRPRNNLPFYKADRMVKYNNKVNGNIMWLLSGYR